MSFYAPAGICQNICKGILCIYFQTLNKAIALLKLIEYNEIG